MDPRTFVLAHQTARQRCAAFAHEAPDGWCVTFKPPTRNLEQNALLWVLLAAFSEQLKWPVNGAMVKLEPEEWKDILSGAFRQETHRIAQGLSGGMVILGLRTSKMGKREFAEFIEFVQAVASERGVKLGQPEMQEQTL